MNANDTDIRPEEMKREPQAFEQLTREELEQTAGGTLMWPTTYSLIYTLWGATSFRF